MIIVNASKKSTLLALTLISGCFHEIEVEHKGEIEVVSAPLEEVADMAVGNTVDLIIIKEWIENHDHP